MSRHVSEAAEMALRKLLVGQCRNARKLPPSDAHVTFGILQVCTQIEAALNAAAANPGETDHDRLFARMVVAALTAVETATEGTELGSMPAFRAKTAAEREAALRMLP